VFEVRCRSPLDEAWEGRDRQLEKAAGRLSDAGGAYFEGKAGVREHRWTVLTLAEAVEMRKRLAAVPGARATIQEAVTEGRRRRYKKG